MAEITNLNYDMAHHLLLRSGFGHDGKMSKDRTEGKLVRSLADLAANKGPQAAIDSVMKVPKSKIRGPGTLNGFDSYNLQKWWVGRMVAALKPLGEKMVLFHHTHFATASSKVYKSKYMAVQNALFREFALGDFRELVKRVTIDAAMLWWLDNTQNVVTKPNENYARELQELFTLGVYDFAGDRNYLQEDVKQAARILTGWSVDDDYRKRTITVAFSAGNHDGASKTMYASTPNAFTLPGTLPGGTVNFLGDTEYAGLVEGIFNHIDSEGHPTVARYIARKMWKFFAYDPDVDASSTTGRADLALIDRLADEFKSPVEDPHPTSKVGESAAYSMHALARKMFLQEEFYQDATRTVKGPTEYVVGSLRMLRGKLGRYVSIGDVLANQGQDLLNPPNVFSWKGNLNWVTTETLLSRYDFARDFAQSPKRDPYAHYTFDIYAYLDDPPPASTTRQAVVDRFLKVLGLAVDAAELVNWLGTADPINLTDSDYVDTYVRGLLHLMLTSPQYHVH